MDGTQNFACNFSAVSENSHQNPIAFARFITVSVNEIVFMKNCVWGDSCVHSWTNANKMVAAKSIR